MAISTAARRIVAVLVLMALALAGWQIWQRVKPAGMPSGFAVGNGRIEATEVDVASKLAGRLIDILPREGDTVQRDQVVAKLDLAEVRAQMARAEALRAQAAEGVAEARAGVDQALSAQKLARASHERTRQLVARNFVSAQKLDETENTLRATEATLDAAHQRVNAAAAAVRAADAGIAQVKTLLEDGELRAPIGGRVQYRLMEPGAVVGAGGKVLTLIDPRDLHLTVYLPAAEAGQARIGDEARVFPDALGGEAVPARVAFVADEAQFTPREVETRGEREKLMFRVKLALDPAWLAAHPEAVKPGMPGVGWLRLNPEADWPASLPRR